MRILIISSYDCGYETTVAVLENDKYINYELYIQKLLVRIANDLSEYYSHESGWELKDITKFFLEDFDYILLCEDGLIDFYKVEDINKPNKGKIL